MSFSISEPSTRVSISVRFTMLTANILHRDFNARGAGARVPHPSRAFCERVGILTLLAARSLRAFRSAKVRLRSRLEQRRRAALPGFPFFLRNLFHVVNIRTSLREDVVQVVADADEGEAFFQELADSRGAEQEQAKDYVVLVRVVNQLFCGGVEFG